MNVYTKVINLKDTTYFDTCWVIIRCRLDLHAEFQFSLFSGAIVPTPHARTAAITMLRKSKYKEGNIEQVGVDVTL